MADTANNAAPMDNRLVYLDQAMFDAMRAGNRSQLMQCLWIYEHPVDFEALARFHDNLGYGLGGRLIQRSVLPFGRHRWVSALGPASDLDIETSARPREEFSDWADEQAARPIDPEFGPCWRLSVLPMTDGSTGLSLVASHAVGDGVAGLVTIFAAIKGERPDLGYPARRGTTRRARLRSAREDARATLRDLPEVRRTLATAIKLTLRRRHDIARTAPARRAQIVGADRVVSVPAVSVFVDIDEWDARAASLGGNTYSLLAGVAARLGARMGRTVTTGDDGAKVNLLLALSDRSFDDYRANAMSIGSVGVDPDAVTTDLTAARAAIRSALQARKDTPDESLQFLPLIPFVPQRAMKRLSDVFVGAADLPVSCSNMGDLEPTVGRPDGSDAEYMVMRGIDQNVIERDIVAAGGHLVLVSGRLGGKVSISVVGYQPGAQNTKAWLTDLVHQTLAEYDLTGQMI
ncbi:hypothetical protein [Mycobacterium sp. ACS4331]|uniref:hypothetical protein n=1 Tax=Mycobacterium sp. ACS4331 TaxID=1834121 RepID=UPI000AB7AFCC|nr:hypothetical protein [Mycobacterium sp. ACS4331]